VLADMGHQWVGLDIAPAMLDVAVERGLEGGDVLLGDMGHGVPFREGSFDGAVSISAAQWLCNADTSRQDPRRRMAAFFRTLYRVLNRGARAVLQIYPQDARQAEMLVAAAMQAGFSGGLVVDYPHSTARSLLSMHTFAHACHPLALPCPSLPSRSPLPSLPSTLSVALLAACQEALPRPHGGVLGGTGGAPGLGR